MATMPDDLTYNIEYKFSDRWAVQNLTSANTNGLSVYAESKTTKNTGGKNMSTVSVEDLWEVFPDLKPEKVFDGPEGAVVEDGYTTQTKWAKKVSRAAQLKRDQADLEELTKKRED